MEFRETQKATETLYKGALIELKKDMVTLADGSDSLREVVLHPGGVCVAALDDQNNLYFVRQFRYPLGEAVLELPAGKREPGEAPDVSAKRELAEETGLVAANWEYAGEFYPSPGYLNEIIHLYIARGLTQGETNPDEGEFVQTEKLPLQTAVNMVLNNEIKDGKTKALVLMASAKQ